eukprot:jgi/Mesvir1/1075/Mv17590-RA.1
MKGRGPNSARSSYEFLRSTRKDHSCQIKVVPDDSHSRILLLSVGMAARSLSEGCLTTTCVEALSPAGQRCVVSCPALVSGGSVRQHGSGLQFSRSGKKMLTLKQHQTAPPQRSSGRGFTHVVQAQLSQRVESGSDLAVLDTDPQLAPFKDHLLYRANQYKQAKEAIEQHGGGLDKFSQGYNDFGFVRKDGHIIYREWAPAARGMALIGDFNGWNPESHRMQRDQFGVWSVQLDDVDGRPRIPHGSRVKVRVTRPEGWAVDRIPAWIKWATVEPGKMGAKYDGIYWDPPASEKYKFKHARPPRPATPRIYEAHVGMSSSEPKVNTYRDFADNVLPRIARAGYNCVQLMAIMEHSYYASFGYHVTNFFAPSSRCGTPEDLKYLIDTAHGLGLTMLMDVIHSHASNNVDDGLNGFDFGQSSADSYFHTGDRGYHKLWDSRLFNYGNWEVKRFLLSNLRFWMEEYMFDGFRFDGVTSMLYTHHGLNMAFSGQYHEYFGFSTDVEACVYMMLANETIHSLYPDAIMIAEDVSGMPTLGVPVSQGGLGFDYRLSMAIPDKWIQLLKHRVDEQWGMHEIVVALCNRRYSEKCIAYAESHDQALVGDKTVAFWLMDKEMYTGMSALSPASPVIERGIALHKMIHFITFALGGDGYLNFMGNEFGHPEWMDFPREGNGWSYNYCRRQWHLADESHLRYKFMAEFDRAMCALDERFGFMRSPHQLVSSFHEDDKVIVFERGDLVFVFNFHPTKTYEGYKVGCRDAGKYRVALDSDAYEFGGKGRVGHDTDHFTQPEGVPGDPASNFNNRCHSFAVLAPSRTCQVYFNADQYPQYVPAGDAKGKADKDAVGATAAAMEALSTLEE